MRVFGGPANYGDDVNDPEHRAVEDAVLEKLKGTYDVEDNRHANKTPDFWLIERAGGHRRLSFDVKHDRYIETTNNVVFEDYHALGDGSRLPGWGHSGLHRIGVVGESRTSCWVYDVERMREYVMANEHRASSEGWKRREVPNDSERFAGQAGRYVTHVWLIPHERLAEVKAYRFRFGLGG